MSRSKVLIIAGMHRSGTSLTANLLKQSGLHIGDALLDHGFDNKKGHFEDLEFLELHENDLKQKGLDTRGLDGIPNQPLFFEPSTISVLQGMIKKREKWSCWGWKEPRTTLFLEAWKHQIPEAKVLAVYRHHDEVVSSLWRRYLYKLKYGVGLSLSRRILHTMIFPLNYFIKKKQAYNAWHIYNTQILKFKQKFPEDIIILELDHLLQHYNEVVQIINSKFSLELKSADISAVFEKQLLNSEKSKTLLRCYPFRRLNDTLNQLKKESVWM